MVFAFIIAWTGKYVKLRFPAVCPDYALDAGGGSFLLFSAVVQPVIRQFALIHFRVDPVHEFVYR